MTIKPTTARRPSKRLPRDQRVAAILDVSREVLRERGSQQFLTSEVAERCGTSEGTIYKYFASKRDLLIQVAEHWFEEFLTEESPVARQSPFRDRLFHMIWRNLSIIRREPALTRFVLMELRSDPNYRQMRICEQNRQIAKGIMDVIADGRETGALRQDISVKLVRDMIFGCIEHQTWAYLRGEGDFSVEASAEGITEIIMNGMGDKDAASPAPIDEAVRRLESVTGALTRELDLIRSRQGGQ